MAIDTIFVNNRMLSQRGVFTVHGDSTTPIEELCDEGVIKIVLKDKAITEALEFCEIANINEFTVYPDMAGIADYVRSYSGLECIARCQVTPVESRQSNPCSQWPWF